MPEYSVNNHPPIETMREYVVWEPGTPATTFAVGDKVRVHLRGECPATVNLAVAEAANHTGCHSPCADGAVGHVYRTDWDDDLPHHNYEVGFDGHVTCRGGHPDWKHFCDAGFGHYAFTELEHVN